MKREKIVRLLTEQRVEIGLSFVQVDQIANALTGEPVDERLRPKLFIGSCLDGEIDRDALQELISDRYDDKHLG